jgi:hypothetical protein
LEEKEEEELGKPQELAHPLVEEGQGGHGEAQAVAAQKDRQEGEDHPRGEGQAGPGEGHEGEGHQEDQKPLAQKPRQVADQKKGDGAVGGEEDLFQGARLRLLHEAEG